MRKFLFKSDQKSSNLSIVCLNENNVLFALFLNKCPSYKIVPNIILFKLIGIFIIFLINLL